MFDIDGKDGCSRLGFSGPANDEFAVLDMVAPDGRFCVTLSMDELDDMDEFIMHGDIDSEMRLPNGNVTIVDDSTCRMEMDHCSSFIDVCIMDMRSLISDIWCNMTSRN